MITGMIALPITVVGGAMLYYTFSCRRARRRNTHNMCARCGQPVTPAHGFSLANLVVCNRCAQTTERNNKAALRFAIGITLSLVILLGIGFGSDYAKGVQIDAGSLKMLGAVLMSVLTFCSIIWKQRVKPVPKDNPQDGDGRTRR